MDGPSQSPSEQSPGCSFLSQRPLPQVKFGLVVAVAQSSGQFSSVSAASQNLSPQVKMGWILALSQLEDSLALQEVKQPGRSNQLPGGRFKSGIFTTRQVPAPV